MGSYYTEIVKRKAERNAYCRGCDNEIKRGEKMVYTYSNRNRGQSIPICLKCAKTIGELVNE